MKSSGSGSTNSEGCGRKIFVGCLVAILGALAVAFFDDNPGLLKLPSLPRDAWDGPVPSESWVLLPGEQDLAIHRKVTWNSGQIELAFSAKAGELVDFFLHDDRRSDAESPTVTLTSEGAPSVEPLSLKEHSDSVSGYFGIPKTGDYTFSVSSRNLQPGEATIALRAQGRYQHSQARLGDTWQKSTDPPGLLHVYRLDLQSGTRLFLELSSGSAAENVNLFLEFAKPVSDGSQSSKPFGRIKLPSGELKTFAPVTGTYWLIVGGGSVHSPVYRLATYELPRMELGDSVDRAANSIEHGFRFQKDEIWVDLYGKEGQAWCLSGAYPEEMDLEIVLRHEGEQPKIEPEDGLFSYGLEYPRDGVAKVRITSLSAETGELRLEAHAKPKEAPEDWCNG